MYLKQHNLQVSGGEAALVARALRYVRDAQQILEPEDNDAASDSELQSSESEDDAQSDSSEMGDFIEDSYEVLFVPDTHVECVTVQSKPGFRYSSYICGWWLGGGGCVIIFGKFGG